MSGMAEKGSRLAAATVACLLAALLAWLILHPDHDPLPPLDWRELAPPEDTPLHPWRWIVIHHSGTSGGETSAIDRHHAQVNGWDGIGYHFVIGNGRPMAMGRIDATWRWRTQRRGAHAGPGPDQAPFNADGIGICVIGDYTADRPDPYLEDRLAELCSLLVRHVPTLSVRTIIGHGEVPGKATACPGAQLDLGRVRFLTRERLNRPAP